MSPMKYDPESGTFVESEGWRSWGCVVALVDYLITLVVIGWQLILMAFVFAFFAIPFGLVVLAVLALFGLI